MLLAAAALTLTAFVPEQADAQVRRFGMPGPVVVGRGPVYAYPRGYYGYRRGYSGPGLGAAVGLEILGGAAAAPYYGDPCLCHVTSSRPQRCGGEHITPPIIFPCNDGRAGSSHRVNTDGERVRDRGSPVTAAPQKRIPAPRGFSLSD